MKAMKKHTGKVFLRRLARFGFTAVELTAVASIIAILSLILMPIVRKRVAESRLVAAADDMRTIQIAQSLALADTGQYFRLADLDNPSTTAGGTPLAFWNRPTTLIEFDILGRTWNGPYTTFSQTKFESLSVLLASSQSMIFRVVNASDIVQSGVLVRGPIMILDLGSGPENQDTPIDPWGSPYIFFGDTVNGNVANLALTTESNFGIAIVYSLGPDGIPGNGPGADSIEYFRESGALGEGDDLSRTF